MYIYIYIYYVYMYIYTYLHIYSLKSIGSAQEACTCSRHVHAAGKQLCPGPLQPSV